MTAKTNSAWLAVKQWFGLVTSKFVGTMFGVLLVLALVTVVMSWISVPPRGMWNWSAVAASKVSIDATGCRVTQVTSGTFTLDCNGQVMQATPLDMGPVTGADATKSAAAFHTELAARVGMSTVQCDVVTVLTPAALTGMQGAACRGLTGPLAAHIVRSGNGELASRGVLRGLYPKDGAGRKLADAQRYAQRYQLGQQGDARAAQAAQRQTAQIWIATLIGFVGLIGGFLIQASRDERILDRKVKRMISNGRRKMNYFIKGQVADHNKESESLKTILDELEKTLDENVDSDAVKDAFRMLRKTCDEDAKILKSKSNNQQKTAESHWTKLRTSWQERDT